MNNILNKIPKGFEVRSINFGDLEDCVKFFNLVKEAQSSEQGVNASVLERRWQSPGFNLEDSSLLILSEKKEILACVLVWDIRQPPVQIHSEVKEHPAYQDLGLGEILLEWAEKRARQAIPNCPQGTKVELLGGISNDYPRLKEIYTNSGFEWCRRELRMHIHFSEEQKAAELPENIQIRRFQKEKDSLAVYRADNEAFADHWGFVKAASEEEGYQQWQYFMEQDERFDPEYWLIALEGEKIAGICLSFPRMESDAETAYVEHLAVLRDFRRRGIAQALLRQIFYVAWKNGKKGLSLHVDSQSLTGATKLYEGVGMKPGQFWDQYSKTLREGENLSTETLK